MSEPPRVRSMNCADSESRPVLGPAGNKARSVELRKPFASKPKTKVVVEKPQQTSTETKGKKSPSLGGVGGGGGGGGAMNTPPFVKAPAILRQKDQKLVLKGNLSLNASCSSDASSDSAYSRASTGRIRRRSVTPIRRKQCGSRNGVVESPVTDNCSSPDSPADASVSRKRCAWVTPNTDPCYAVFHDEEWGVPAHDDKKLFELLSLSTALAEITWPAILNKRHMFREVFHEFDPAVVSKLNEKKIAASGCSASLLSELKLRGIIENAKQVCKIVDEFGSFDKYIWGFVNHKPIVGQFRYPRQVPIKTSKADSISKDLVRRGFRGVGPTVVYSFMQVAGMTNDHLISCFRFAECLGAGDARIKDDNINPKAGGENNIEDANSLGLTRVIDELSLSTE